MNATLEYMRDALAAQIFSETDCAVCPPVEAQNLEAMVERGKARHLTLPSSRSSGGEGGRVGYRWNDRPKQPRRGLKPQPRPRAGEMRLVHFINAEVARCGVSWQRIYARLMAGKYVGVTIRRPAPRVTFVSGAIAQPELLMVNVAQPGEVSLKEFVAAEAARLELTDGAIYMRLKRGMYPGLEFRRVNQRVVFVKVKK